MKYCSLWSRCEMKFVCIRVSEYFTFAMQIFHSEAISLARRANFVEKSTHCLDRQMCAFSGADDRTWSRSAELGPYADLTVPRTVIQYRPASSRHPYKPKQPDKRRVALVGRNIHTRCFISTCILWFLFLLV